MPIAPMARATAKIVKVSQDGAGRIVSLRGSGAAGTASRI
jgi:hypothetical protein